MTLTEWLLFLPLLLLIICLSPADGARSLSARRVRGPSRNTAERYDRSITTFDPEGRLLQLEYALIAAEARGRGLTVCVEWDGNVIFAFPSSIDDSDVPSSVSESTPSDDEGVRLLFDTVTENNPTHNSKVHRLSPTHLLLTSGLSGDAHVLASAFRRVNSSWTHQHYGEVITTRELAAEVGRVRHSIGLRPGARVLGVIGLLIGLDENEQDDDSPNNNKKETVRMYRSLPGGTIDKCNVCVTGGGADADGNLARKEAMKILSNLVAASPSDSSNKSHTRDEELQRIIEKVTEVALNCPHAAQMRVESAKDDTKEECKQLDKVDVWIVRALESHDSEETNKLAFTSTHRRIGKASIDIRYARRVSRAQLTTAAKSLIHTAVKIQ